MEYREYVKYNHRMLRINIRKSGGALGPIINPEKALRISWGTPRGTIENVGDAIPLGDQLFHPAPARGHIFPPIQNAMLGGVWLPETKGARRLKKRGTHIHT